MTDEKRDDIRRALKNGKFFSRETFFGTQGGNAGKEKRRCGSSGILKMLSVELKGTNTEKTFTRELQTRSKTCRLIEAKRDNIWGE